MADLGVGPPAITTSIGSCKMRPTSVSEFKVWHMKRVMVEEIRFEVIKMLTNFYFLRHVSANRNLTFRNKILSRLFTSNKLPNSSLQSLILLCEQFPIFSPFLRIKNPII